MFGSTTITEIIGIGALCLFGAYVHYRVSVRRTQTRLAVCMLEDDDSLLVNELERLVEAGKIKKLSKKHMSVAPPSGENVAPAAHPSKPIPPAGTNPPRKSRFSARPSARKPVKKVSVAAPL